MKRKRLWLFSLGLIGMMVIVLILTGNRLAPPSSVEADTYTAAPLIVLSPKKMGQDPNQVELLQQIEAQGSAAGLDFSSRDLSHLDLSPEILTDVQQLRELKQSPVWLDMDTGGANLTGLNLADAILIQANLSAARLVGANLQGAHLIQTNLSNANLAAADLSGANLAGANLSGANLGKARLVGADLSLARLAGADLWRADLNEVYLFGADLKGVRLAFADLSRVNLAQATSLDGAWLYRARLDGVTLTREALGETVGEERAGAYDQAREVYVALKNVFRAAGQYDDARWATIKERQMEQATHWPPAAPRFYGKQELPDLPLNNPRRFIDLAAFYGRHTAIYVSLGLWGLTSGYNQSPLRVIITAVFIWFGLALLYRLTDGLVATHTPEDTGVFRLHPNDYLGYSFSALVGRDWKEMQPVGKVARIVTQLAPLIGFTLVALLVITLTVE